MIDSNLFEIIFGLSLPRPEHVYLEPDFDLLGEGALGEHGLDLGHHGAVDHAALGADGVDLLPDPGDDGEILREVRGQDPRDPIGVQILKLSHFWTKWVIIHTQSHDMDKSERLSYLLHQSSPAAPPARPPPWPPGCAPSMSRRCLTSG